MALSDALLPGFDQEMKNTRRTLERVPEDKLDWRPHEKSMTLGGLTTHISNLPSWASFTINQDSLDIAPVGEPPLRLEQIKSAGEALEMFDKNVAAARAAIAGASDEHLARTWTLLHGGHKVFALPRAVVLRTVVMNHIIHHRAQLGVYLRFTDVTVPSLPGPSADSVGF